MLRRSGGESRVPQTIQLEDEKVLGMIHIALGDNTSFSGGHTKSEIHLDDILLQATVRSGWTHFNGRRKAPRRLTCLL